MRFRLLAIGLAIAMYGGARAGTSGDGGDGHTTVVRDANGVTVITQSGDPAKAEVRIEKAPGQTTVYRRSGGNTAIVTQSSDAAGMPQGMPGWMRKLRGR